MANYFRMDGWVKTAQGPAVPGAQIYVCTQPANSTLLPPTPLANIYSDVNGLVPITQPIITDGFGHYDFYALAGAYTIIVAFGGIIQQVYTDQSLGSVSGTGGGGGTALVLETNGVLNGSQVVQNLVAGSNMALADDGNGTITLTSSGVPAGTNVWPGSYAGLVPSNGPIANVLAGSTWTQMLPGSLALCTPAVWKFTLSSFGGNTTKVVKAVVAKTVAGSLTVSSFTPVTFNNGSTSVNFTTTQTSDAIAIQIDADYDYYIMVYYDPTSQNTGYWQATSLNFGAGPAATSQSGDKTATSPLTTSGGQLGMLFRKIVSA